MREVGRRVEEVERQMMADVMEEEADVKVCLEEEGDVLPCRARLGRHRCCPHGRRSSERGAEETTASCASESGSRSAIQAERATVAEYDCEWMTVSVSAQLS